MAHSEQFWRDEEEARMIKDFFAGLALIGIVSRGETTNQYEMASDAYKIADAMMEERSGRP
jgi:hypothetical protein